MTTLFSGTGSTITHAMSVSGLSVLSHTAIVTQLSVDASQAGSITVVAATISDHNLGY